MSVNSARVVCTGCDYQAIEVFRPILIQYHTAAGELIEASSTKGWCYCCDGYSDIEHLNCAEFQQQLVEKEEERDSVQVQLVQLSSSLFAKWWHRSTIRWLRRQLDTLNKGTSSLRQLIEIAGTRTAKARCLKCWSDKTAPISFNTDNADTNQFTHQCGGHLQLIHSWDSLRFHFKVTVYTLSEEGERL